MINNMPRRGSEALQERQLKIGQLSKELREKKEIITNLSNEIDGQTSTITNLRSKINENGEEIENLKLTLSESEKILKNLRNKQNYVKNKVNEHKLLYKRRRKRKLQKPTGESELCQRSKIRRCADTFTVCSAIHGGDDNNISPTIDGMLETVGAKCPAALLATKILSMKPAIRNAVTSNVLIKHCNQFYRSEENALRSLNIYYCSNVLGKNKYISVRKANARKNIPNLIPYATLSKNIRDVDIGNIIPIQGQLDHDLDEDQKGVGMYRDIKDYLSRLAKFYLTVNEERYDKLLVFNDGKIDNSSVLFLFTIGGDEAPGAGTSFLLSFLNAGKRVCSSFDNFLIFGGMVKESGEIVRRYLKLLMANVKYVENKCFKIDVGQNKFQVEFKLELLPNDLKMLAFLAGELSNSAYYFSTFANVHKDEPHHFKKSFGTGKNQDWKPFPYTKRLNDVKLVEKKKSELVI